MFHAGKLRSFVNDHYWLDGGTADQIHQYRVEGYGGEAQKPLNIQPEDLPRWTVPWLRDGAGYLAGNVGPGRLERALEQIEARVSRHEWPEYYDDEGGDLVGRRSRLRQTWTAAGYLLALHLLENPEARHQFGYVPCS